MQKRLSLLLAALLLAVSVQTAWANDEDDEAMDDAAQVTFQADDDDAIGHPLRLGHPAHWGRGPAMRPGMHPGIGRHPGMGMHPGMMGRGMMGPRGDRSFGFFGIPMIRDIDLTDAQKSRFIDAQVDVYKKRLVLRMEQDELYQKLKKEWESDNPNHETIVAVNKAMGEVKGRLDVAGREYFKAVQDILTPEQREKIKDHIENVGKRMKERAERGNRGPGMPGKGPRTLRGPGPQMQ